MIKHRKWDRHKKSVLNFTELGFGSAPLGNLYKSIFDEEANDTLNSAWDLGVRYYDTAPLYGLGLSETRLNRFLRFFFSISNCNLILNNYFFNARTYFSN